MPKALNNTAIAALSVFASLLFVLAIMTVYWIVSAQSRPAGTVTDTKATHTAQQILIVIEQTVPGTVQARVVALFNPVPASASVGFTDKAGNWYVIATLPSKQSATTDEQAMGQGIYMVLQRNDCLLVTDPGAANSDIVLAFDRACS